jgi:hypothetical protein
MAGAAGEAVEMIDEAEAAVGKMLLEEMVVFTARAEILAQTGAEPKAIEVARLRAIESAHLNGAVLFEIRADIALANLTNRSRARERGRVSLWAVSRPERTVGRAVSSGRDARETGAAALTGSCGG